MQKRNLIIFSVLVFSLATFVSAYSSGRFSVGSLLDDIEPSTLVLPALFIIFFTFINFSLGRVFKDNKSASGIIAFAVSLMMVYGINKLNIDFDNLFLNWGISGDVLSIILPLLFIGLAVFLVIKFDVGTALIAIGVLFLIGTFTEIIYETGVLGFLGALFLVVGVIMKVKFGKRRIDRRHY
jgi:hypothetical protein